MDLEARYEFVDKIGSGSYATVYRARDNELGREVAVKQIHSEYMEHAAQLERYWQEAQLLASLAHPNIVTIFDIYRERGWLILELMQANLADRLAGRPMNLKSLRTTVAHSLRALKYLHSRGIVHGDIKPSNLMIDARKRIKIGDFGLARRVSDEEGSLLKGTTKYMAPEVLSDEFGEVGPASDLYSLGFCGYELMCGSNFKNLFPGLDAHARNMQAAWMMWHAAPDRRLPEIHKVLEGVPDDLAHVIQKLCEKDQSNRYASADEALSDLNIDVKIIKEGESSAETSQPRADRPAADRKRLWIAAAAIAVSLLLSLLILFSGNGEADTVSSDSTVGIVDEVDVENRTIVVRGIEDDIPFEIKLGSKPRIFLINEDKHILLRQVKTGDRIEVGRHESDEGSRRLELTVARPQQDEARFEKVRRRGRQPYAVVTIDEADRHEVVSLRVPESADIRLNGERTLSDGTRVALTHLKPGDEVTVRHIAELGRQGGRLLISLRARRRQTKTGYVSSVEPDKGEWGTLTIRYGKAKSAGVLTRPVAENCRVTLQDSPENPPSRITLADLERDDYVRFTYDELFREVAAVRRELAADGTVKAVHPERDELVVTDSETGRERTFEVGPRAAVSISQEPAALSELRDYDEVTVHYEEPSPGRLQAVTVTARRPVKNRLALVIGVESYDDPSLTPLQYAIDNANEVRDALVNRYAVAAERTLLLSDPTGSQMKKEIPRFLMRAATPDVPVVVYFSGHAYVDADNAVYLAPRDFRFDKMAQTGVRLGWLVDRLEACVSQNKILFLDATHGGNGEDLKSQPSTAEMLRRLDPPKTTALIASCDEGQRGLLRKDAHLGLFASAIAEGFRGPADANRDLFVTAQEMAAYLKTAMSSETASDGGKQTAVPFLPAPQ